MGAAEQLELPFAATAAEAVEAAQPFAEVIEAVEPPGDRLVKVISFDAHGETHSIPLGIEVPYKYVKALLDWVDFRDAILFAPEHESIKEGVEA